mmetsp:Transcript_43880/g.115999  ORF Transcript_43880/g.115999 Transcript_43880/m.115999 type:complete len:278 (+) Transcript_43880:99-932(+)
MADFLALPALSVLLASDPFAVLFHAIGLLLAGSQHPLGVLLAFRVERLNLLNPLLARLAERLRHRKALVGQAGEKNQKVLLGLGRVREVDDEAAAKAGAHRARGDQLKLLGILRVELERRACAAPQALVQRLEEAMQPHPWIVLVAVRIAEPLHGGDGDGAVEDSLPERHAQTHVLVHKIALYLAPLRHAEHVAADVHAHPSVPVLFECFATQPGAAAHVEQQAIVVLRQAEHLECTFGHLGLDLDHAAVVQVFLGFRLVVEDIRRRLLLGPRLVRH